MMLSQISSKLTSKIGFLAWTRKNQNLSRRSCLRKRDSKRDSSRRLDL